MELNTQPQPQPKPQSIIYASSPEVTPPPVTPSQRKIILLPFNILFLVLGGLAWFYAFTIFDLNLLVPLPVGALILWCVLLLIKIIFKIRSIILSLVLSFLAGYFITFLILYGSCMIMISNSRW